MTVVVSKVSLPNVWSRECASISEAVDLLRAIQCGACMHGDEYHDPLDFDLPDGTRYECRDVSTLLSTGCGLEFEIEGDHGLWVMAEDVDPEMGRHSRRKSNPAQMLHEWIPSATGALNEW